MALNTSGLPSGNLQPGQSGSEVTALQRWLISNGYNIPDGATGYYGPQTKAAVTQLQRQLGVNTQGNDGYFGPATRTAVQSTSSGGTGPTIVGGALQAPGGGQNAQQQTYTFPTAGPRVSSTQTQDSSTKQGATKTAIPDSVYQGLTDQVVNGKITPDQARQQIQSLISSGKYTDTSIDTSKLFPQGKTFTASDGKTVVQFDANGNVVNRGGGVDTSKVASGQGVSYDPSWSQYGISQSLWGSMDSTQQAMFAAIIGSAKSLYSTTGNAITLNDAINYAQKDPTILAKYTDAAGIDKATYAQTLQQYQTAAQTNFQAMQTQFENERKQLAAASDAAGRAYSGFRGLAQEQMGQQESAMVTSSLSDLQSKLNSLTTGFESKYGTGATIPAMLSYTNPYTSAGTTLSGTESTAGSTGGNLTGALVGGITGTQPTAQKEDVLNKAYQVYTAGAVPAA